ncbi:Sterol O-acyltransferase 2 (Sterol-ester synthase 2) [Microbotryomycetes sp. JL201]|nr:Sterol O-acyltransferase 2 (Sterol-ester synthase 2) [Microbotryomycetes sp. JL201]
MARHPDQVALAERDGVPGPASLMADAAAEAAQDGSTGDSNAASDRALSQPMRQGKTKRVHKATTTVTTVADDQEAQVTTQTFTHTGSSRVTTHHSKQDGSIIVRPIPTRGRSQSTIKTARTGSSFEPRVSRFDRDNANSATDPFRGFYTLFWIAVAVSMIKTAIKHWSESNGIVFHSSTFIRLISRDGWALAASDGVMVGSTLLCVPFAQALKYGWIRYEYTGMIIQHVLQTLFLATSIRWTFHRQWPWVQSGFLVLHTLTMLMKVHSYCTYNGDLATKARKLKTLERQLDKLCMEHGGRTEAEREARSYWEAIAIEGTEGEQEAEQPVATKANDYAAANLSPPKEGLRQRNRRRSASSPTKPPKTSDAPRDGFELLTWHPNERISILSNQVLDLKEALVSTGVKKVQWPDNIGYINFLDYLLVPTLVYHLEYPRTNSIRPLYVVEKVLALFGTFSILILIVEHWIIPVYPKEDDSFLTSVLDLALPFMLNYLLIFYLIFECVCNVFAELTFFADREFYQDWWNSTTFDEFSRRWNVPVHSFLLRHVYSSTISAYSFSKFQAAFCTFLLSACVHELVMAVVMKKIRLYLFLMQMAQLPLIMIGRLSIFKRHPALGNLAPFSIDIDLSEAELVPGSSAPRAYTVEAASSANTSTATTARSRLSRWCSKLLKTKLATVQDMSDASVPSPFGQLAQNEPPTLAHVARLIKDGKAKNIIVLAGAGISTAAGIPDFRSPETGLYANLEKYNLPYPEAIFDIDYFMEKPQAFYTLAKELYPGNFEPTLTHYFFRLLRDKKVLKAVFTQNIDTLERIAGLQDDMVVEAHGSFAEAECLACKKKYTPEQIKPRIMRGEIVSCDEPYCQDKDTAFIKPKIVFFGESLPDKFFDRISDLQSCDLLFVMGTSLTVQPFASLIHRVPASCPRVLVNLEKVGEAPRDLPKFARSSDAGFDFDGRTGRKNGIRDVCVLSTSDEGVKQLCQELGWSDELTALFEKETGRLKREASAQSNGDQPLEDAVDVSEKQKDVIDSVGDAANKAAVAAEGNKESDDESSVVKPNDLADQVAKVKLDESGGNVENVKTPSKAGL